MNPSVKNAVSAIGRFVSPVRFAAAAAMIGIFLFLILGDKGIYQLRQLAQMKQRLMAERAKLNDDIDKLTREKAMLENPENLESTIRTELGYIKPGEIVFEEKKTDPSQ
ncbi:MAG: septum formation initiator family protein [Patescibacteria group bacterium]